MQKLSPTYDPKGKPRHERAYWTQCLADLLKQPFKVVFGRTALFTSKEIEQIYLTASGWKTNPPALANKLLKEKREEIKRQLKK